MSMRCEDCGSTIHPGTTGSYRQIIGWEKLRPGGGLNGIVLRRETGKILCAGCGERRKLQKRMGIVEGQQTLM